MLALPPQLGHALRAHRTAHLEERQHAGSERQEHELSLTLGTYSQVALGLVTEAAARMGALWRSETRTENVLSNAVFRSMDGVQLVPGVGPSARSSTI